MEESQKELRADIRLYLQFLQNAITRMADYSKTCKQVSLSLLTAWIVFSRLVLSSGQSIHCLISLSICLPILVLWLLDSWYLLFERRYRNKYNNYIKLLTSKIKEDNNEYNELIEKLYNLNPISEDSKGDNTNYIPILISHSVVGIYISQIIIIVIMMLIK